MKIQQSKYATSLWSSINFRAIYSLTSIKPLVLYQFQNIIQTIIQQASDIISISEHYPAHHSTNLWYPINFRAKYSPASIKPLILYQVQSIIHPSIQKSSYLISNSDQYTQKHLHYIMTNSDSFLIRSIQKMRPYILNIIKYLKNIDRLHSHRTEGFSRTMGSKK